MPIQWNDPFPTVAIESIASGTPVIAWNRSSMGEIIEHGKSGFAVRLSGQVNGQGCAKDAFHEYVVHGNREAVNPANTGTKFAPHYVLEIEAGQSQTVRLRLSAENEASGGAFAEFDNIFAQRQREADEFYETILPAGMSEEARCVARQAYAGLLWSKQFYHYVIRAWLNGAQPPPPPERHKGRNREWAHLFSRDIISMPDKWEYPWFAAWDLACGGGGQTSRREGVHQYVADDAPTDEHYRNHPEPAAQAAVALSSRR
jgi:hypothetical protein